MKQTLWFNLNHQKCVFYSNILSSTIILHILTYETMWHINPLVWFSSWLLSFFFSLLRMDRSTLMHLSTAQMLVASVTLNRISVVSTITGPQAVSEISVVEIAFFICVQLHIWRQVDKILSTTGSVTEVRSITGCHDSAGDRSRDVVHFSTLTNFVPHTGIPVLHSGVQNMTVLKTTKSGFEGFHKDRFTTLQDAKDRCFCTSVYSRWRYNKILDVDFDAAWYLSV